MRCLEPCSEEAKLAVSWYVYLLKYPHNMYDKKHSYVIFMKIPVFEIGVSRTPCPINRRLIHFAGNYDDCFCWINGLLAAPDRCR
jgi:hypothetical protein